MNTERVEAGPYKAELIDGLWMVTGPNGWKSHNGDCRDRFDSDMVAKRMNYAHTAALAAADSASGERIIAHNNTGMTLSIEDVVLCAKPSDDLSFKSGEELVVRKVRGG